MNAAASDIVAKLWNLCHILRDDGVTYHQYVTELTYLLFLKMMQETDQEDRLVVFKASKKNTEKEQQSGIRWSDLMSCTPLRRLDLYKELLRDYGRNGHGTVQEIYANASTFITKPVTLSKLVEGIDKLDWYSVHREDLGDLYEGLLARNANEKKSGAGQYFTPRELIDSIVAVMKPSLDDVIQDPAAGTSGFLIAANHYLRQHNDFSKLSEAQLEKYRHSTFYGIELVQDAHRLSQMNMLLHGIEGGIQFGDTLAEEGEALPPATLILSNPPFGTKKGGGLPTRGDFTFPTANKQFCFLQHIYLNLKRGGRAAVVLPDNVLFESNIGAEIRKDLMDKCNLHTILRLPAGLFYAQGVRTNVLFFTRGASDKGNTKDVWVYDMRANMPQFNKRTPLTRGHFAEFEAAFGKDPFGLPKNTAKRKDTGEQGRFRKFSREWIAQRGESLDIAWLRDENLSTGDGVPEPAALAREAMTELESAYEELRGILAVLGEDEDLLEVGA
ncbi:Type I restriction enzyme EcoKI M protein [Cupriavidus numazuensis]|uniref:site-specific DNA-methyltransferase (adenine-specific) n=2 Tax=Cupriavidus numazuensis TaxID=221992 RepID=A0ABM8TID0_9BURK|nr:Type I restriction enzyme EcoKI M protein [Cupriavidus numazuensis]